MRQPFLLVLLTTTLMASPAARAQIAAGEYVSGGGLGVLRVTPDKGGALRFQLNARGANFHLCELSGVIRNGESRMDDSADEKLPCVVTFRPQKGGIVVDAKHQGACSTYCGARAHFEGAYTLAPTGCAPSQVRQTRNHFKAVYDKRLFAEARDVLAPVVDKCASVITEFDDGWIRNDLALTHYRAGDSSACRNTLQPWLELARKPDAVIRSDYPPSDAEEMLRIAGATRANLKLCGAALTGAAKGKP